MRRWTREDNERLYVMWRDGLPYRDIAAEFSCTVCAVKGKLRDWGLRRNRTVDETATEVRRLVAEGMTKAEAAKRLGVSAKYARAVTAKPKGDK